MIDRPETVPPELEQLLDGAPPAERDHAWSALIANHSRLILSVARTVATEHDGVMDAYAHVLERLREDDYRRLRGYVGDGRSTFMTWLVVVTRRLCIDHYRRRYGRPPRGETGEGAARVERAYRRRLFDVSPVPVDLTTLIDDGTPGPDAALRVAERDDALVGAMSALAPEDRVLLKLRFEDDLSAREIANVLQMPSAFHVYRRLAFLCASLRRRLVARGVENSAP